MPIKDVEARKKFAREYNREWREKIRALVLEAKNGPCIDCGGSWPPRVMDFHHSDGKKEFGLAQAVQSAGPGRYEAVKAELQKCVLLCSNCHRLRHGGN